MSTINLFRRDRECFINTVVFKRPQLGSDACREPNFLPDNFLNATCSLMQDWASRATFKSQCSVPPKIGGTRWINTLQVPCISLSSLFLENRLSPSTISCHRKVFAGHDINLHRRTCDQPSYVALQCTSKSNLFCILFFKQPPFFYTATMHLVNQLVTSVLLCTKLMTKFYKL